jgi:hypothetical protein
MPTVEQLFISENVCVRLVTVLPGEAFSLQRHADKHSLAIPLGQLERDTPYELLVHYLMHHAPPKSYYSLNNASTDGQPERFLQVLWTKKP